MDIFIKLLYLVVGGMGGYFVARQLPSALELKITQAIQNGLQVMIAFGDTAYLMQKVDGKVVTRVAKVEAYDVSETVGNNGPTE